MVVVRVFVTVIAVKNAVLKDENDVTGCGASTCSFSAVFLCGHYACVQLRHARKESSGCLLEKYLLHSNIRFPVQWLFCRREEGTEQVMTVQPVPAANDNYWKTVRRL